MGAKMKKILEKHSVVKTADKKELNEYISLASYEREVANAERFSEHCSEKFAELINELNVEDFDEGNQIPDLLVEFMNKVNEYAMEKFDSEEEFRKALKKEKDIYEIDKLLELSKSETEKLFEPFDEIMDILQDLNAWVYDDYCDINSYTSDNGDYTCKEEFDDTGAGLDIVYLELPKVYERYWNELGKKMKIEKDPLFQLFVNSVEWIDY